MAKIACGKDFCMLTDVTGKLFTWGANEFGQLGLNDLLPREAPC